MQSEIVGSTPPLHPIKVPTASGAVGVHILLQDFRWGWVTHCLVVPVGSLLGTHDFGLGLEELDYL